MCTIQGAFFLKNGSSDWGNCNATMSDKIEVDIVVTFSPSEVGKTVRVGNTVLYPDTIDREKWSPSFYISSTGTYDFIILIDKSIAGPGQYKILGTEVWDYIAGAQLC